MMVTVENGDSFLCPLLRTLGNKTAKIEDRIDVYHTITERIQSEKFQGFDEDFEAVSDELLTSFSVDIQSDDSRLVQSALQAVGFCLHQPKSARCLATEGAEKILKGLCSTIMKTSDKTIATRALWCLAKQELAPEQISCQLETILKAVEHAVCSKGFQSMTVEHEATNAIIRLLEQVPGYMNQHAALWGKLLYPLALHSAGKVREQALVAMEMGLPGMVSQREQLSKNLVADLKVLLLSDMNKLMSNRQEVHILKVWSFYVALLGKNLHHGTLINQLLPVVEQGFKNPSIEVKCAAYKAWVALMSNFAQNPDIISDVRRVKLLMQVFKINNAKVESVALEKFNAWWIFHHKLGVKLSSYFDQVCAPFLQFCLGPIPATSHNSTPRKPGMPASSMTTPTMQRLGSGGFSTPGSPQINIGATPGTPQSFRTINKKGCEALALILCKNIQDPHIPKARFSIEALDHEVITGVQFFVKHADTLIGAVTQCFTLADAMTDGVLFHMWYALVAHVKNVLDTCHKKEGAAVFPAFLSAFQTIVLGETVSATIILRMMQAVLCLPSKALSSSAYNVGTSQTAVMQSCPALFLLRLMFHRPVVESCVNEERFLNLLEKLVGCGTTTLRFSQSVLKQVDQAVDLIHNKETVWRIWSAIVHPLLQLISKTNEVNQGDVLEYDFTCLYEALYLPMKHLLGSSIPQPSLKTMLKTWGELYVMFARIAALVTNADDNVCCEDLCSRILGGLRQEQLKVPLSVEALSHVCSVVINQVEFSSLSSSNPSGFNFTASSPTSFGKRRHNKALSNLFSFVKLLAVTTEALHNVAEDTTDKKANGPVLQLSALNIVSVIDTLFTHLPVSAMIASAVERLAPSVGKFYEGAARRSGGKMYSSQVMEKLEKLWHDLSTCLQGRYNGVYDSDFLSQVSPLLETTFLHSRRQIKNQTIILWNATFAHSAPLVYPDSLKPVLAKVKEKTPILLPGWDSGEMLVIGETPASQMSQAESQVPMPNMVGMVSPAKIMGSFMNKAVSPNVKSSPLKPMKSPAAPTPASARRKLDGLKNDDFVVIKPSPKRKRVLTEHQKEKLKDKSGFRALPAMYSNLDASQDISLMSQISMDSTSQMETPSPVDISMPFHLFSSKKQKMNDGESKVTEVTVEMESSKASNKGKAKVQIDESSGNREKKSVRFSFESDASEEHNTSNCKPNQKGKKEKSPLCSEAINVESKKLRASLPKINSDVFVEGSQEFSPSKEAERSTDSEIGFAVPDSEAPDPASPEPANQLAALNDSLFGSSFKSTDPGNSPKNMSSDSQEDHSQGDQNKEKCEKDKTSEHSVSSQSSSISERTIKRASRRLGKDNYSQSSQSSQEEETPKKGRTRPVRSKSPQRKATPKRNVQGSASIANWVVVSPRKTVTTAPPVLVEETQQFSPEQKDVTMVSPCGNVFVEETPVKNPITNLAGDGKIDSVKKLFPGDSGKVTSPVSTDVSVPEAQVIAPIISLHRLTKEEIHQFSPLEMHLGNEKEKQLNQHDATSGTNSSTSTRTLRRRSSMLKFSKGSQENEEFSGVKTLDMDDIIPSSQDSFALQSEKSDVKCVHSSVEVTDSNSENGKRMFDFFKEGSEDPVEETSLVVSSAGTAGSEGETVAEQNEEDMASKNPDIIPMDFRSDSSQTSQETVVCKRTRRKPKRLDDEWEDQRRTPSKKKIKDDQSEPCSLEQSFGHSPESNASTPKQKRGQRRTDSSSSQDSSQEKVEDGSILEKRPTSKKSQMTDSDEIQSCSYSSEGSVNQSEDSNLTPKRKRGRPRKKSVDSMKEESNLESVEKQKGGLRKAKAKDVHFEPKLGATFSQSLDESCSGDNAVTAKSNDECKENEKPKNTSSTSSGEESKDIDTLRTMSKGNQNSNADKCYNEDSDSDDDKPLTLLAKPAEEEDDLPLTYLSGKSSKKLSNGKTDSDVNSESGNAQQESKRNETNLVKSKDACDNKSSFMGRKNDNVEVFSCTDLFADSVTTSTPTKGHIHTELNSDTSQSPVLQCSGSAKRKSSKPQRNVELDRLSINMKSPVGKRLRSNKAALKSRSLNRSLDSIQRKRKIRKPSSMALKGRKTKDDMDMKAKGQDLPDDNSSGTLPFSVSGEEKGKIVPLSGTINSTENNGKDLGETVALEKPRSPMKVLNSLSPPKKGKPFDMPETPTSAPRNRMCTSRAHLILERARMFSVAKSSPSLFHRKKLAVKSAGYSPVSGKKDSPAKPGILKVSVQNSPEKTWQNHLTLTSRGSPPPNKVSGNAESPIFRPIHVPQVFSPAASPSAGILKKRKLSGERPTNSPSPPNKQRRVSFADSIDDGEEKSGRESPKPVNRCLDLAKNQLITSPLVTTTPSRVSTSHSQSKFLTTPSKNEENSDSNECISPFAVPQKTIGKRKESQPSQTPGSLQITQESQLNSQDPVFPELVDCSQPVEAVLHQLTSSTWVRGLGQLVRARHISTVGHLAALSEYEINNLPIRSPKVETVKKALQSFTQQISKKSSTKVETSRELDSPLKEDLPRAEDELEKLAEVKDDLDTSIDTELGLVTEAKDVTEDITQDPTTISTTNQTSQPKPAENIMEISPLRDPMECLMEDSGEPGSLTPSITPLVSLQLSGATNILSPGSSGKTENVSVQDSDKSEKCKTGADNGSTVPTDSNKPAENNNPLSSKMLLKDLKEMSSKLSDNVLEGLPSHHLVQMHQHLNTMMTNVVMALKAKCPLSPTNSQASQGSQSQL